MASYNVTALADLEKTSTSFDSNTNRVSFFKHLKNDKEEILVRFVYDDLSELNVESVHEIENNGRFISVPCVRDVIAREPISKCPLCESGNKMSWKAFIKMIVYIINSDGTVTASPEVWKRPRKFVNKMMMKYNKYVKNGTKFSDYVFSIIRNGRPGDTGTEYEIEYENQEVFDESIYVKDFSAFNGFDANNHPLFVSRKSVDDMRYYVENGTFSSTGNEYKRDVNSNNGQTPSYGNTYHSSDTYQRTEAPKYGYVRPEPTTSQTQVSNEPIKKRYTY